MVHHSPHSITEDFWLIVVTEGNEDETEIHKQERPGGEGCSGYSPLNAIIMPNSPVGNSMGYVGIG
jgi:hypothetical protein